MSPRLQPAVVLVADRTLSARYQVLFEGIFATAQTGQVPGLLMRRLLSPPERTDADGRALAAPLGLRRVEAALLARTALGPRDVVVTTPEALPRLLGPWTRVVGVSSSDPLGHGMSNTTTQAFSSGPLYTQAWTARMMTRLAEAARRWGFRVVVGGAGAWQYRYWPDEAAFDGPLAVFEGYFEADGPAWLAALAEGKSPPAPSAADAPAHGRQDAPAQHPDAPARSPDAPARSPDGGPLFFTTRQTAARQVVPIRGPSTMGVVELSRGCGNGCRFCLMAGRPMEHLDPETVLADVETNVAGGRRALVSASEDFFRYGAEGRRLRPDALIALLERMEPVRRGAFVQLGHANITSVLALEPQALREIRRLLRADPDPEFLWVNLGLESASGRLVRAVAPGKMGPADPDAWPEMAVEAAHRLRRAGFFPVFSVILGLPGETPDDLLHTRRLVDRLAEGPVAVFPVFHEPVRPDRDGPAFGLEAMTPRHLDLYTACYEINFRWIPRVYRDNQRAGGVGWLRRAAVQALGRAEIWAWRRRFRHLARSLGRADGLAPAPQAG